MSCCVRAAGSAGMRQPKTALTCASFMPSVVARNLMLSMHAIQFGVISQANKDREEYGRLNGAARLGDKASIGSGELGSQFNSI